MFYEDVKNLKVEVKHLKETMKSLIYIRDQSEIIKLSVDELKVEIKLLAAKNQELTAQLKELEYDWVDEEDTIAEITCELKHSRDGLHDTASDLKCDQCHFLGNLHMELKKHTNT